MFFDSQKSSAYQLVLVNNDCKCRYILKENIYIYVSWLQRGALQADPSEWETVTAEARRHDRFWLNDKLKETHVSTLRGYLVSAKLRLGNNPRKDSCISALLDQVFPVAPRFCRR